MPVFWGYREKIEIPAAHDRRSDKRILAKTAVYDVVRGKRRYGVSAGFQVWEAFVKQSEQCRDLFFIHGTHPIYNATRSRIRFTLSICEIIPPTRTPPVPIAATLLTLPSKRARAVFISEKVMYEKHFSGARRL